MQPHAEQVLQSGIEDKSTPEAVSGLIEVPQLEKSFTSAIECTG